MILDANLLATLTRQCKINIRGTVTDKQENPLQRTVFLYDSCNKQIAKQNSDENGRVSFTLKGYTINDQFTAVGTGHWTENPGISVVCRGIAVLVD